MVVNQMKVIFNKKVVATVFIGVAFAMVAAACSHSSDSSTGTTESDGANGPVVVAQPSTNTAAPTDTTTARITTSAPTEPQVNLTTRYILTANPELRRQDDRTGRIPSRTIQVFKTPNGDSITQQMLTDVAGEPLLDFQGNPRTTTKCLQDFPESCLPTDPTYWGAALTLLVTQGVPGDEWAEVILSTRPNNTRGWVRVQKGEGANPEEVYFKFTAHDFHIIIDLSENTVSVWKGILPAPGQLEVEDRTLVAHTLAILGTASTPTPVIATTYIEAKLPAGAGSEFGSPVFGSWVLPLAGFSTALETFGGGIPQLALHGTNIPGRIGEDLSNGCIRIPNEIIEQLAAMIPIGTPVSIIA